MKAITAWFHNAIFLLLPLPYSEHFNLETGFSLLANTETTSKHCSAVLLAVLTVALHFQICQIQMSKGILVRKLRLPRTILIPVFTILSKYFRVSLNCLI